jgi:hypothetical protein
MSRVHGIAFSSPLGFGFIHCFTVDFERSTACSKMHCDKSEQTPNEFSIPHKVTKPNSTHRKAQSTE